MQATTTTAEDRVARAGTAAAVETVTEPVIESTRGASPARIGSPGSAAAAPRMRTRGFASVGSLKLW